MAKYNKIAFGIVLLAVVTFCCAEPPRFQRTSRVSPRRIRNFARHEAASRITATPTPYPSAEELKPEVPFEEGAAPDQTYGPPDQTYGPPDQTYEPPVITDNNVEQLPTNEDPEEFAPNPDAEEFAPPAEESTEARLSSNKTKKSRLQATRLSQNQRRKTERLVAAPAVSKLAPISVVVPLETQQLRLVSQPFAYTAQFQVW